MSRLRQCTPSKASDSDLAKLSTSKTSPAALYNETWTSIPQRILARRPPHMLKSELVAVLNYKLSFGQNRPSLRGMIGALGEADVRTASEKCFSILAGAEGDGQSAGTAGTAGGPGTTEAAATKGEEPDTVILRALDALTTLRGVGPATASLVLSLLSPSTPFFSDEVAVAVLNPPGGRKGLKYTKAEYKRFLALATQENQGQTGRRRKWERSRWLALELGEEEDTEVQAVSPLEEERAKKPSARLAKRKRGDDKDDDSCRA